VLEAGIGIPDSYFLFSFLGIELSAASWSRRHLRDSSRLTSLCPSTGAATASLLLVPSQALKRGRVLVLTSVQTGSALTF
jgi:hypothetical protein